MQSKPVNKFLQQRVNNTSGLQIHSIMYRFHPSVKWTGGYPNRQQIVSQITELWKRYGLESKTTFDTRVEKVYQDSKGRWIINDESNGRFEGIIAAVGTCGDAKMPHIPGQDKYKGEIYHSSDLTGKDAKGKKIIVIGGGASAVEALEFAAHEEAAKTFILARSDKWIIPRNPIIDVLLSFNIFGQETMLSWIPELLLKKLFYRDLEDLAPTDQGLFTGTPMVNSDVMDKIRTGEAEWLRGDIKGFTEKGIRFSVRAKGVPPGGPGRERDVDADIVVMATGYSRPSLNFLPEGIFQIDYDNELCTNSLNRYIQGPLFPTQLVLTNLPSIAPIYLCKQLHICQCHWNSWKLAYRNLHSNSPYVPDRSTHAPSTLLDAALD